MSSRQGRSRSRIKPADSAAEGEAGQAGRISRAMKNPSMPPLPGHSAGVVRRPPSAVIASSSPGTSSAPHRIAAAASAAPAPPRRAAALPRAAASTPRRPAARPAAAWRRRHRAGGPAAPSAPRCRAGASGAARRDGGGWCRWRCTARPAAPRRAAPPAASAAASAATTVGLQAQPGEIVAQPGEPRGVALDRCDLARRRRPVARSCRPGRRTDRRRARRGAPPAAAPAAPRRRPAPRTRPRRSRAGRSTRVPARVAPRPSRQRRAARRRRRAGRERQVERRLVLVRLGDGARLRRPRRPIARAGVSRRGPSSPSSAAGPACGHPAQHGVHQPGEGRQPARPRQRDRGGHRGMRRRAEQQQPGRAEAQHVAHRRRRGLAQQRLQHGVQRAQPAQHRGGQPMGGGAVARLQRAAARPAPPPAGGAGRARRRADRRRRRGSGRTSRASCRQRRHEERCPEQRAGRKRGQSFDINPGPGQIRIEPADMGHRGVGVRPQILLEHHPVRPDLERHDAGISVARRPGQHGEAVGQLFALAAMISPRPARTGPGRSECGRDNPGTAPVISASGRASSPPPRRSAAKPPAGWGLVVLGRPVQTVLLAGAGKELPGIFVAKVEIGALRHRRWRAGCGSRRSRSRRCADRRSPARPRTNRNASARWPSPAESAAANRSGRRRAPAGPRLRACSRCAAANASRKCCRALWSATVSPEASRASLPGPNTARRAAGSSAFSAASSAATASSGVA